MEGREITAWCVRENYFASLCFEKLVEECGDERLGGVVFANIQFAALLQQADAVEGGPEDLGFASGGGLVFAKGANCFDDQFENSINGLVIVIGVVVDRDSEEERPEVGGFPVEIEVGLCNPTDLALVTALFRRDRFQLLGEGIHRIDVDGGTQLINIGKEIIERARRVADGARYAACSECSGAFFDDDFPACFDGEGGQFFAGVIFSACHNQIL